MQRDGGRGAFLETLSLCPIDQMSASDHPLLQGMRRRNFAGHTAPCNKTVILFAGKKLVWLSERQILLSAM